MRLEQQPRELCWDEIAGWSQPEPRAARASAWKLLLRARRYHARVPDAAVIDPTITDIAIPSAAVLISTAIALIIANAQLRASKRERRSEAVARVADSISQIIAEASRLRRGEDIDLEPAMSSFDAAIIQLNLTVRRREQVVVSVIRNRLFVVYVQNDVTHLEATSYVVRRELEQWALGYIPISEFRRYATCTIGEQRIRTLSGAWYELAQSLERDAILHQGSDLFDGNDKEIAHANARGLRRPFRYRIDDLLERFWGWRYRP